MFNPNHYAHDQSYVPTINRPHAIDQWTARTPAELRLVEAWKTAIPVNAPECDADSTRLYVPYDVLLVERGGVLRTVLHNDGRIDTAGLSVCPGCEGLYDPLLTGASCRWCDGPLPSRRSTGGVTLVVGGGQR
jgi:hypothetical protein